MKPAIWSSTEGKNYVGMEKICVLLISKTPTNLLQSPTEKAGVSQVYKTKTPSIGWGFFYEKGRALMNYSSLLSRHLYMVS